MRASFQRHWLSGVGGPLIADDAGTVAHVVWNGVGIADRFGNSWTQNGTVPQVARAGRTPAGSGPFSDVNYYSLGAGNDVLDFAGDFTIALVLSDTNNVGVPMSNGTAATNGYFVRTSSLRPELVVSNGATTGSASNVGTGLNGSPSVFCCGRTGNLLVSMTNLSTLNTSPAVAGAITPATATTAKIGRYAAAGLPYTGTVYEAWFSTTTPTEALFNAIQVRVKSKAGITAW